MEWLLWITLGLLAIFAVMAALAIRYVPPNRNAVVHRGERFDRVLEPGWHLLMPGHEKVIQEVEMGGRMVRLQCERLKSSDQRAIAVDGVVYFQILEAHKVVDYVDTLDDTAADLARRTAEEFVRELNAESLVKRPARDVNSWLVGLLNQSASQWGVRITRIDLSFEIETPAGRADDAAD